MSPVSPVHRQPPGGVSHRLLNFLLYLLGEEELGHKGVTELLRLGDVARAPDKQGELVVGHLVDIEGEGGQGDAPDPCWGPEENLGSL